jgi:hypothetical protein
VAVADLSIGAPGRPETEAIPGDMGADFDATELLLEEEAPHVDEHLVEGLLRSLGGGLGYVAGDPDVANHWRFTEQELRDVVPPLTRIINRRPQLRRAVARGDEMAVAIVLAGYAGRNVAAGQAAKEVRRERQREADSPEGAARAAAARAAEGHGGSGLDGGGLRGSAG